MSLRTLFAVLWLGKSRLVRRRDIGGRPQFLWNGICAAKCIGFKSCGGCSWWGILPYACAKPLPTARSPMNWGKPWSIASGTRWYNEKRNYLFIRIDAFFSAFSFIRYLFWRLPSQLFVDYFQCCADYRVVCILRNDGDLHHGYFFYDIDDHVFLCGVNHNAHSLVVQTDVSLRCAFLACLNDHVPELGPKNMAHIHLMKNLNLSGSTVNEIWVYVYDDYLSAEFKKDILIL